MAQSYTLVALVEHKFHEVFCGSAKEWVHLSKVIGWQGWSLPAGASGHMDTHQNSKSTTGAGGELGRAWRGWNSGERAAMGAGWVDQAW